MDVYKGPLADHKDLQVQRLASMTDGAGPLLVRLQSTLCEEAVRGSEASSDGANSFDNCDGWTQSNGNDTVAPVGFSTFDDAAWTFADTQDCTIPGHLYCFEL